MSAFFFWQHAATSALKISLPMLPDRKRFSPIRHAATS